MRQLDRLLGRLDLEFRKRGVLKRESFGLSGLDHLVNEHVHFRNGIFVEAGGNDGISQSNSLYFEKYLGWCGLLVEPAPHIADLCRSNRPNAYVEQCALVSSDYDKPTIDLHYCNLMSVVDGCFEKQVLDRHLKSGKQFLDDDDPVKTITVPARTLSAVIDDAKLTRVDLLSLDVEGFEVQVLKGLDFSRHAPAWMVIEGVDPRLILNCVGDRYEHVAALTEGDQLYRRR